MSPSGASSLIWPLAFFSVVWSFLIPILSLFVVATALSSQSFVNHGSFLIKEQLRAIGKVMLWTVLFIVPGIYKHLRYLLVPFVVLFDREYQAGNRDALQTAHQLSRGHLFYLSLLFLFFSVVFPSVLSTFDEKRLILSHPVSAVFLCLIEMTLNICFIITLYRLYLRSLKNEPTV